MKTPAGPEVSQYVPLQASCGCSLSVYTTDYLLRCESELFRAWPGCFILYQSRAEKRWLRTCVETCTTLADVVYDVKDTAGCPTQPCFLMAAFRAVLYQLSNVDF